MPPKFPLTISDEAGPVVELAHKVVTNNRKALERLRDEWGGAIANIKSGPQDYLKLEVDARITINFALITIYNIWYAAIPIV